LGSLGEQFPDTDPAWRGAGSSIFVSRARDLAAERGLEVGNLDAIVIAESPRLAPHVSEMRRKVAGLLGVETEFVSIRGTSSNGLGFAGRGEGIAVMVAVTLVPPPDHKSQITNHNPLHPFPASPRSRRPSAPAPARSNGCFSIRPGGTGGSTSSKRSAGSEGSRSGTGS